MGAVSINVLELSAATDSKITHISLYSSRAEVTRTCTFKIKPGVNKVKLNGLSNDLDTNSLRVEGRGLGTIHDVTPSLQSPPPTPDTSPQLTDLKRTLSLKKRALERSQQSLTALNQFLATLNIQHVNPSSLSSIVENYEAAAAAVDLKILELETEIEELEAGSASERQRLQVPVDYDAKLRRQVSVGVVAEEEGEFTLIITYAVSRARWSASYDIRVNTQAKTEPVTLVYKASISQSTDESWDNIPVTLETATPTIGNKIPMLDSWRLSVLRPFRPTSAPTVRFKKRAISAEELAEESDNDMGFGLFDGEPTDHIGAYVTSKGNVSATFRIPGVVTIPGDGSFNTFTIAELQLDAALSWISIPRVEPKVHLTAKIKNSSSFTLLPGNASVYVDKSFISETHMAGVSPMEKFECPLGLDDTIRVTYHPQSKKQSQSGFYNKSVVHVYSQRITVHNTKPDFVVENLKILDHIPVSQDEEIKVKLVEPALALPGSGTSAGGTIQGKEAGGRALPLAVVDGAIVAQWEGSEDMDVDVASLGKDGKMYWLCTIQPQEKLNLTLQWEISAPAKTSIVGL